MAIVKNKSWHYNKSAVKGDFKKIPGFEAWFWTGGSLHFGHYPPRKSGKKR